MPKVLIAGEKAFAIHTFTHDELSKQEIIETRSDSVTNVGKAFDKEEVTPESLDSVKDAVIMLLKQSQTYKFKAEETESLDGYVLTVFKGRTQNGRRSYISSWLGKMSEDAISRNPQALIPQLVNSFKQNFNLSDYHKKSLIHSMIKD